MSTPLPALSPPRLYAAHLGLVGHILSRRFPFLPEGLREDAYAAGLLGLWLAAQRFDPSRGYVFSTFAGDYIHGHIRHFLKREERQNALPVTSLETPVGVNEKGELADIVADPQAERPGAALEAQAGFDALLRGLPERHRQLLRAVYQEDKGLAEIAGVWGLTKQRAGQIHLQALARLRKTQGGLVSNSEYFAAGIVLPRQRPGFRGSRKPES